MHKWKNALFLKMTQLPLAECITEFISSVFNTNALCLSLQGQ